MAAPRWTDVESIFHKAVERPTHERDSFIEDACAGDEALRRQVDSLIVNWEKSGGLLSAPVHAWALHAAAIPLPLGTVFSHYEIIDILASGGMADVYLARDTRLNRRVALKILPEHLTRDPEWTRRFQREARTLSALNEPNILTLYDMGQSQSRLWIAAELIEGVTLRHRLALGRVDKADAVAIIRQVLKALSAAHRAGVVHRDVKPENIMVRNDGLVKLLDFGLAKAAARADDLTDPGTRLGTARYMSPEQACGGDAGPPADVWSAAVVCAELLTGVHPFAAATPALTMAAIHRMSPQLQAAGVYRPVLEKALARNPAERYSNADEFLHALNSRGTMIPLSREWLKWVSAACLAAFTGIGVWWWPTSFPSHDPFEAVETRRLISASSSTHLAVSPDGSFLAYTLEEAGRHRLMLSQLNGAAPRVIPTNAPHGFAGLAFSQDGYLYYAAYDAARYGQLHRVPIVGEESRHILSDIDSPPSFSPDGRRMAFVRFDNRNSKTHLSVAAADGSGIRIVSSRKSPHDFSAEGCAWSPDGKHIYLAAIDHKDAGKRQMGVVEVDVESGAVREQTRQRWPWIGPVAALRDGWFAFPTVMPGGQGAELMLLSPKGTTSRMHAVASQGSFRRLSAAGGNRLVALHSDRSASIWVAPANRLEKFERVPMQPSPMYELEFSRDGSFLSFLYAGVKPGIYRISRQGSAGALLAGDLMGSAPRLPASGDALVFIAENHIWRARADGSDAVPLTRGPGIDKFPECCTADGRVVFVSDRDGLESLWTVPLAGGAVSRLTSFPAWKPALDESGTRIVFAFRETPDSSLYTVAAAPAGNPEHRTILPAVPENSYFRWSPGGRSVSFIRTVDGVANVWEVEAVADAGPPKRLTAFSEQSLYSFAWSQNGSELAALRGISNSSLLLISERKD